MIKIKDDFDLDKLVGFEKGQQDWYYFWNITKKGYIAIDRTRSIHIGGEGRFDSVEIPFMLYNLFKMGIIEEVRSE